MRNSSHEPNAIHKKNCEVFLFFLISLQNSRSINNKVLRVKDLSSLDNEFYANSHFSLASIWYYFFDTGVHWQKRPWACKNHKIEPSPVLYQGQQHDEWVQFIHLARETITFFFHFCTRSFLSCPRRKQK